MADMTPDVLMEESIRYVVFAAANHIERTEQWLKAGAPQDDIWRRWCEDEERIGHSCRVAMTLRAAEVVALCESIHLHGCTEARVRDNPFKIAMAIRIYQEGVHPDGSHQKQD